MKKISSVKIIFQDHRRELEVFWKNIMGPTMVDNINGVLKLKKPAIVQKAIAKAVIENYDRRTESTGN